MHYDFYYQIKGCRPMGHDGGFEWAWPPIFSGLVQAADKKAAKQLIEEEYEREFPLRVLKKDMADHAYLLRIEQIGPNNAYILRRFQETCCKECAAVFRLIDKYNDANCDYKGDGYCSRKCAELGRAKEVLEYRLGAERAVPPVIYQIKQRSTGKAYVGQTTQPFTLRWWQHLTTGSGCKFHEALRSSDICDWEYSILETIACPEGCTDKAAYILDRERHWIETLDTVRNGFNTVRPSGINPQETLPFDTPLEAAEAESSGSPGKVADRGPTPAHYGLNAFLNPPSSDGQHA